MRGVVLLLIPGQEVSPQVRRQVGVRRLPGAPCPLATPATVKQQLGRQSGAGTITPPIYLSTGFFFSSTEMMLDYVNVFYASTRHVALFSCRECNCSNLFYFIRKRAWSGTLDIYIRFKYKISSVLTVF